MAQRSSRVRDGLLAPPSVILSYKLSKLDRELNFFSPLRYEDEINKRTECENDFVLIKKVSVAICICCKLHTLSKIPVSTFFLKTM